jgi:hypothetical protein
MKNTTVFGLRAVALAAALVLPALSFAAEPIKVGIALDI